MSINFWLVGEKSSPAQFVELLKKMNPEFEWISTEEWGIHIDNDIDHPLDTKNRKRRQQGKSYESKSRSHLECESKSHHRCRTSKGWLVNLIAECPPSVCYLAGLFLGLLTTPLEITQARALSSYFQSKHRTHCKWKVGHITHLPLS